MVDTLVEVDLKEDTKCVGKAKSTGKRCTRNAIPGGTVCRIHGGAAPQVMAKAAERIAKRKAEEQQAYELLASPIDPWEGLEKSRALQNGLTGIAAKKLVEAQEKGDGVQQRAWEALLAEHLTTLAQLSKIAIAAGHEERKVQVEEIEATILFNALTSALDQAETNPDLMFTPAQREAFLRLVGQNLRALPGE